MLTREWLLAGLLRGSFFKLRLARRPKKIEMPLRTLEVISTRHQFLAIFGVVEAVALGK